MNQKEARKRRKLLASEAIVGGRGGISEVAKKHGASRNTIRRGIEEMRAENVYLPCRGRRKRCDEEYPWLGEAMEFIVSREQIRLREDVMPDGRTRCVSGRLIQAALGEEYGIHLAVSTIIALANRNGIDRNI